MSYTNEEITTEINKFFPATPLSGEIMQYSLGYDIELTNAVEKFLKNKTWHEIDWFFMINNFSDVSHLPSALNINSYSKIFPSLLVYCLEGKAARQTLLVETFIDNYLNINNLFNNEQFVFLSSLTDEQARCVALMLNYCAETDNDLLFKKVLDSYWSVFL